jgi:hypothetical protein
LPLSVRTRSEWTTEMSAYELDRMEKESFLAWRRKLSEYVHQPSVTARLCTCPEPFMIWLLTLYV